jgi:predicted PurR-regulated permease PerM
MRNEGGAVPGQTRVDYWFLLIWKLLLRLALIAVGIYAIYRSRFIIVTVILAALLAVAIEPLVGYLYTRRALRFISPAWRRLLVTSFVFLLVVIGLAALNFFILHPVVQQVVQFLDRLPQYQTQLQARLADLQAQFQKLPPDVQGFLRGQHYSDLTSNVSASLQHLIQRTWQSTWRVLEMALIPFLTFYFVLEPRSLKKEFIFLVPRRRVREALLILRETAAIMRSYVIGQAVLAGLAGLVVGVGLSLLGVNYALALGVWSAITRAIPVVGPMFGGIPVVLMATAQSWETGMGVLVFFSLLHLFESKVLMPKIIGYQMRLHPAIIIIVLLIGCEFFGLMGMFLAAPIAAVIKVLINYYVIRPQTRRFGPLDVRPGLGPRREEIELDDPAVVVSGHHSGAD